jgi:hypothetical protein
VVDPSLLLRVGVVDVEAPTGLPPPPAMTDIVVLVLPAGLPPPPATTEMLELELPAGLPPPPARTTRVVELVVVGVRELVSTAAPWAEAAVLDVDIIWPGLKPPPAKVIGVDVSGEVALVVVEPAVVDVPAFGLPPPPDSTTNVGIETESVCRLRG